MTKTQARERSRQTDQPSAGTVRLRNVTKTFGDTSAVHDLDLDVAAGEFVSMLGPSGSGKTTVLRMIAGFEEPTSGTIELGGVDVTNVPPYDRRVNTVFQDYALFPHLTIAENVGYGLKVRRVSKAERATRVQETLEKVRLGHVGDRLPNQLSGGQRQRIALARALILEPEVLLLDEPLGALDKQLREEMQIELKQIQRRVGITFIFVTHDQEEALTLSDRVAVFNNGKIEQVGTAREVYEHPQTDFVARFLGLSNLIPAETVGASGATVSIRPERVRLLTPDATVGDHEHALPGTVAEIVYTGPATRYVVDTDNGMRMIASVQNAHHPEQDELLQRGERVLAVWTADHASVVP
ncbi:ABC transporter ATP-binding protein [Gulosibacter macacae]|uniref:ABC transporter ATP-binding protein n=1 Tax=Gulosibacter macacae TaxID=2488791 RepID=A0A3P3VZL1_9MICO|nr:ABC transporter ATP-binding protein [Gulosibacter macacae]RRJ88225.1 ABC transporter ATP-binding protein [Gulosibacter macacae]